MADQAEDTKNTHGVIPFRRSSHEGELSFNDKDDGSVRSEWDMRKDGLD